MVEASQKHNTGTDVCAGREKVTRVLRTLSANSDRKGEARELAWRLFVRLGVEQVKLYSDRHYRLPAR